LVKVGVTLMLPDIEFRVVLTALKLAMAFPVPDGASPIDGWLFVQLKTVPFSGVGTKLIAAVACPLHNVWFPGTVTDGTGFTVTNTWSVLVHPVLLSVPITLKVVVAVGAKLTPFTTALSHKYWSAPVAVKVIVSPAHITISLPAKTVGRMASTVTITLSVAEQPEIGSDTVNV